MRASGFSPLRRSSRSGRLRRLLLTGLALTGLACGGSRPKTGPTPPNLVVLVMDTTRADRCSLDGYSRPTTPDLEALAREGTAYTDAWSSSPWTGPSHATLFTGLRPEHHGFLAGAKLFLGPEADTLAEILSHRGYRTECVTNNVFVTDRFGLDQGFDTVHACVDPDAPGHPSTPWAHGLAREFIAAAGRDKVPFFLFVNDMDPHLPYAPPANAPVSFLAPDAPPPDVEWARAFDGLGPLACSLGRLVVSPGRWQILGDLYDAEIATLDGRIGELVDWMRKRGTLDSTILVVLGDHGENLGDHGLASHEFSVHRTVLRVPLLVRYPKEIASGRVVSDPVRVEDVFPTVLGLAGVPVPRGIDGKSLLADLPGRICRGVLGPPPPERFERDFPGFTASKFARGIHSVYDGRYHYIEYSDGAKELFDVRRDPAEKTDLSDREPAICDRLAGQIER